MADRPGMDGGQELPDFLSFWVSRAGRRGLVRLGCEGGTAGVSISPPLAIPTSHHHQKRPEIYRLISSVLSGRHNGPPAVPHRATSGNWLLLFLTYLHPRGREDHVKTTMKQFHPYHYLCFGPHYQNVNGGAGRSGDDKNRNRTTE